MEAASSAPADTVADKAQQRAARGLVGVQTGNPTRARPTCMPCKREVSTPSHASHPAVLFARPAPHLLVRVAAEHHAPGALVNSRGACGVGGWVGVRGGGGGEQQWVGKPQQRSPCKAAGPPRAHTLPPPLRHPAETPSPDTKMKGPRLTARLYPTTSSLKHQEEEGGATYAGGL